MSFRPDSPVELPDGRLVCGAHGFIVCGYCTVDYSFINEILDRSDGDSDDELFRDDLDDDDSYTFSSDNLDNSLHTDSSDLPHDFGNGVVVRIPCSGEQKPRVGTGLVHAEKFTPPKPTDVPQLLFPSGIGMKASPRVHRFIRHTDSTQLLVYTDGACLNNGSKNPQGGCAFVYRPAMPGRLGHVGFHLESKGPTGQHHQQTSNRAELRAVLGALRFRYWTGEGFKSIVIATDSEYVVEGATKWVRGWVRKGWKTSYGQPVKNKDLWQALLGEFERWSECGLKVKFWRIPRNLNTEADRWAKDAAEKQSSLDEFMDINGMLV